MYTDTLKIKDSEIGKTETRNCLLVISHTREQFWITVLFGSCVSPYQRHGFYTCLSLSFKTEEEIIPAGLLISSKHWKQNES